ncbi:hypothetical protein Asppvi_010861 [Aspergillus pseudoviridinutans]|uniref:Uncharacterized protein n=1 Tax=Aspergillus pseudoviridinutans TaxID=1517512 RepID=A0A9P3EXF2_9EURO|nr:uncharacterized protein Asppvi_010861 [Aspergillus pseudoviridinutans]GIJ91886.1 hypothetical protein Asppvi_010861 [Aspergillus pseudoviridinutans]
MQHSDSRVAEAIECPPTRADAPQCRPFSKTALSIGRYIELDDFPSSTNHVHNDRGHVTSSKKKRRSIYLPNTLWTRSFGTTVILETLATVGIESWVLVSMLNELDKIDKSEATLRIQSFLGLYIFALLYELALSYDALRRKNTFQLVGLCICNLGLFIYGIIQMREIRETVTEVVADTSRSNSIWSTYQIELILVPVFLGVGTAIMAFVTWKLRAEFSWSIYKDISADLRMNRRYTVYQVYIALLKFDWFFIFGTQLQILLSIQDFNNEEFMINAAMVPVAIITLALAAFFCRREKRKSLVIVMFFMAAILTSIIKTMFQMYRLTDNSGLSAFKTSLTLFAAIATFLISSTLVNSVWSGFSSVRGSELTD